MRVYYDTEFVADGRTIDLLSIGMVRDDGKTYYAVVADAGTIGKAVNHEWLRVNVVDQLPIRPIYHGRLGSAVDNYWSWDWITEHPDFIHVKTKNQIREEVKRFLLDTPSLELWAWYAAYDHVALAQLFGTMMDLPQDIPMWTNDLRQELHRLGNPRYPEQASGEHNALDDALWNKTLGDYLQRLDGPVSSLYTREIN